MAGETEVAAPQVEQQPSVSGSGQQAEDPLARVALGSTSVAPRPSAPPSAPQDGARLEPKSVSEMVDEVLAISDAGVQQTMVRACMTQRPKAFIQAFAARPAGRQVLAAMVNGSALAKIPNFAQLLNVFGYIPQAPGGQVVQGIEGGLISLPFGIVAGVIGGIQSLIGRLWSALPGSHRDFVQQLMTERYEVEVTASFSEDALRLMYNAFDALPPGHVKGAVDQLGSSGMDMSSWFKQDQGKRAIEMSRLLPTSVSMGTAEHGLRFVGKKFLKKNSKYSERMRDKNAFTMTTLHEVGHAVDAKLNIMHSNGHKPEFGGWREHGNTNVVEAALAAFSGGPEIKLTDDEQQRLMSDITERDKHRAKANAAPAEGVSKQEHFKNVKKPAMDAVRERDESMDKTLATAENRAWEGKFRVSKSMLTKVLRDWLGGASIADAVKAHPEAQGWGYFRRRTAVNAIEDHPVYKMLNQGKGQHGWERDSGDLAKYSAQFGGRAFHISYPGPKNNTDATQWVSYDVGSKKQAVSHYQYRAPGEWFAELYAHYFMGTLTDGKPDGTHPLYGWMKQNVDKRLDGATGEPKPAEDRAEASQQDPVVSQGGPSPEVQAPSRQSQQSAPSSNQV